MICSDHIVQHLTFKKILLCARNGNRAFPNTENHHSQQPCTLCCSMERYGMNKLHLHSHLKYGRPRRPQQKNSASRNSQELSKLRFSSPILRTNRFVEINNHYSSLRPRWNICPLHGLTGKQRQRQVGNNGTDGLHGLPLHPQLK